MFRRDFLQSLSSLPFVGGLSRKTEETEQAIKDLFEREIDKSIEVCLAKENGQSNIEKLQELILKIYFQNKLEIPMDVMLKEYPFAVSYNIRLGNKLTPRPLKATIYNSWVNDKHPLQMPCLTLKGTYLIINTANDELHSKAQDTRLRYFVSLDNTVTKLNNNNP